MMLGQGIEDRVHGALDRGFTGASGIGAVTGIIDKEKGVGGMGSNILFEIGEPIDPEAGVSGKDDPEALGAGIGTATLGGEVEGFLGTVGGDEGNALGVGRKLKRGGFRAGMKNERALAEGDCSDKEGSGCG
jgi:hypothetical protein